MSLTVSRLALPALVLCAGCFAKLDAQPAGDGDSSDDASPGNGGSGDDSAPDAARDAAAVAVDAPNCAERQVVLMFEGVTLTRGPSDALARTASWVGEATGTTTASIPPYRLGDPNRLTLITQITERVRAKLAQFPIIVVTELPATENYVLVALGGTAADSGSSYGIARNVLDCGNAAPNDVSWIADGTAIDKVDDYVVGAIAYGLGLGGTEDPGNCMCSWRNGCRQNAGECALSASITAVNDVCAQTPNPQDQVAAFDAGFCQ